jgi:hypothetical protein
MQTNWSSTMSFAPFNTSLGTLTSVTLSLGGSMTTTLAVGNISNLLSPPGTPDSGNVDSMSVLSLQDSGGSLTGLQLTLATPLQTYGNLQPTYTAASSTESWSLPATGVYAGTSTSSYTAPAILAEFSGPGDIVLNASGNSSTDLYNTGGAAFASQVSDTELTGIATYTYVTPEPSTFALLAVGIGALLAWRMKRPKAAGAQ